MYDLKQLEVAMAEKGLDVLNLSRRIGRSEAGIRQLFRRGRGRPATVKQIADFLGVPMKQLLKPKPKAKPRRRAA